MTMSAVSISVVVPVKDGRAFVDRCVAAVVAQLDASDELIVVDDGSTDGGPSPIDDPRGVVVRLAQNIGRGPARNHGARRATGEVLLFVDADVVLHHDVLDRVRRAFADPATTALIGSYDDRPAAPGTVSQYRNLLHRFGHLNGGHRASHFWTGIGAVRRDVFLALGGIDEARHAHVMEDVEFGHRLCDAGHEILVDTTIQGSHLKAFTFPVMVRTDLVQRAIPWSHLMLDGRRDHFVQRTEHRMSVVAAGALVAGLTLVPVRRRLGGLVAAAAAATFTLANRPLWAYLHRVRSVSFAVRAWPLHVVHSLIAGLGFAWAVAERAGRAVRGAP